MKPRLTLHILTSQNAKIPNPKFYTISGRPTNCYNEHSSTKWLYVSRDLPKGKKSLRKLGEISIEYGNEIEDFLKNS